MLFLLHEKIYKHFYMQTILAFFLLIYGLSWFLKFNSLFVFITGVLIIPLCTCSILIIFAGRKNIFKTALLILLIFLFFIRVFFTIYMPWQNAIEVDGSVLSIQGKVIGSINEDNIMRNYNNFFLDYNSKENTLNQKINREIIIKTKYGKISVYGNFYGVNNGDRISGKFFLVTPDEKRNPGGFNQKKYYSDKGIFLKGYPARGENINIEKNKNPLLRIPRALRKNMIKTFYENLPSREAALVTGIITGSREGIHEKDILILRKSGLSHIIAVSGAVVAFIMVPLKFLISRLKIKRHTKVFFIISILFLFATMASWTVSVTRAVFMISLVNMAAVSGRKVSSLQVMLVAVNLMIFINPSVIFSAGFLLSVSATGGIILFYKNINEFFRKKFKIKGVILSMISLNISVCISIFPVTLYFFSEINLASLVSNLFVMPVMQIAVVSGFVLILLSLISMPALITSLAAIPLKGMISFIYFVASVFSGMEFLIIRKDFITGIFIIASFFALLSFLMKNKKIKKLACASFTVILCINISVSVIKKYNSPDLIIVFADVCQGDATLIIHKKGKSVLIDGGGQRKGHRAVSGILDYYRIDYPSFYIVTHMHEDHSGGITGIISERGGDHLFVPWFTVEDIFAGSIIQECNEDFWGESEYKGDLIHGYNLLSAAYAADLSVTETGDNNKLVIDEELKITFLNPEKKDFPGREKGGNESSLVLYIEYKDFSFIIMGDATDNVEKNILRKDYKIDSDIYRISHHGSPTSTNHGIIRKVDSNIAVISVGVNNYGHPCDDVLKRLKENGIEILRTDHHGAVIVEIKNNVMRYKTMIKGNGKIG